MNEKEFRARLAANPSDLQARVGLVEVLRQGGDRAGAASMQMDVCLLEPGDAEAWRRLAMLQLEAGWLSAARISADKFAALSTPDVSDPWYGLHFGKQRKEAGVGRRPVVSTRAKDTKTYPDSPKAAVSAKPVGLAAAPKAQSRPPSFMHSKSLLLRDLTAKGDRSLLDVARGLASEVHPADLDRFATILNASANALGQREQWDQLIELLKVLLGKVPDDLRARLKLALTLVRIGRSDEAIEHLVLLLTRHPTRPGAAHLLVGNASADTIAEIARQIVPLTLAHIQKDGSTLADGIRVLTYLMSFDHVQRLVEQVDSLRDPKLADAVFEYAMSTNEHEVAEQAFRDRNWLPGTEDEKDVWRIRIALLKADHQALLPAFKRLAEGDKLNSLRRQILHTAGLSLGRYSEAFSMDWLHQQRPAIAKLVPNLYQPDEDLAALAGRNVLIIARTELGDEIRLIELVDRIRAKFGACTIVVDRRIRDLVARDRPDLSVVGTEKLLPQVESTVPMLLRRHLDQITWERIGSFDRVLLITDLQTLLVKTVNDLPHLPRTLEVDQDLRAHWRKMLQELPRPRIGLFWRSGLRTFKRSAKFTALGDWKPVFEVCSQTYVSLQYGSDVKQEISEAQPMAEVMEMPDFDAKNDIDALAALMCELDLVLTIPGTNQHLAGAVGARTLAVTHPSQALWRARPGTRIASWSPSVEVVSGPYEHGFAGAIVATASRLREILSSANPA